jgi:hypothetical protein
MHASLSNRQRPSVSHGGLWAVVLSLVLVAGCDTGGPGGESTPPIVDTSAVPNITVTVPSDTLDLPGTLLMPDTSASVPGAVIVHGSGPVDRNGEVAGSNIPPVYRNWAERMAERGIAVLRYDKRTTLREVQQASPSTLTFLDFVRDAVAAGNFLRNRKKVDADRIVFVGHSQGGNVAPAAATRLGETAGVAALASPAFAIDSLVVSQLKTRPEVSDSAAEAARAQFDSLRTGPPPADGLIEIGQSVTSVSFWRQWIRHSQHIDSVATALESPLYVQHGRADATFPGTTLQRSLNGWRRIAQTDDATVTTYDGVDHFFQEAETNETADAPLDDLIRWIHER